MPNYCSCLPGGISRHHLCVFAREMGIDGTATVGAGNIPDQRELICNHFFVYALLDASEWRNRQQERNQLHIHMGSAGLKEMAVNAWCMVSSSRLNVDHVPTISQV